MSMIRLAVLGSTGSIGRQALDVAARNPDRVQVVALSAHSNHELLCEQARTHHVRAVALSDPDAASEANRCLGDIDVESGPQALQALSSADDVDVVLNALVGAAGLRVTIAALDTGKSLALANKESLVVGGEYVTCRAALGQIIPVDSEHSAIYQCLLGEPGSAVNRIWLTASGGPFRGRTRADLADVTPADALAHPTWSMGPKISIDSATLMNKGLETIEAHHLFDMDYDDIHVVVQPQSCIHSMVEFCDGSVKAHLGASDMRIPIQYALSQPDRWDAPTEPVDFATLGSLDFEPPDLDTFGCLRIAFDAGRAGGTAPAVMNAANEVAVAAFLEKRCGFLDIERIVDSVLSNHSVETLESIEQIEGVDSWARSSAEGIV